jgi:hypothetical protein
VVVGRLAVRAGGAGGAGGFPAGWKPTFRDGQDCHPPSGRLASYAATPTDNPGYFRVILCALNRPPEDWPNGDNKFVINLQSDDQADGSIAVAIADKLSRIGKALTDSVITGLNWGQPKPCLVMLQWNMGNPAKPYLEALDAKRLDWEP